MYLGAGKPGNTGPFCLCVCMTSHASVRKGWKRREEDRFLFFNCAFRSGTCLSGSPGVPPMRIIILDVFSLQLTHTHTPHMHPHRLQQEEEMDLLMEELPKDVGSASKELKTD